ncbi:hypothetical protein B0H11DRAFT_2397726 [Mycena galericulata]|nr:hypothetical protein B0H11DRAFT_2397726 [Mycena galericulata]
MGLGKSGIKDGGKSGGLADFELCFTLLADPSVLTALSVQNITNRGNWTSPRLNVNITHPGYSKPSTRDSVARQLSFNLLTLDFYIVLLRANPTWKQIPGPAPCCLSLHYSHGFGHHPDGTGLEADRARFFGEALSFFPVIVHVKLYPKIGEVQPKLVPITRAGTGESKITHDFTVFPGLPRAPLQRHEFERAGRAPFAVPVCPPVYVGCAIFIHGDGMTHKSVQPGKVASHMHPPCHVPAAGTRNLALRRPGY